MISTWKTKLTSPRTRAGVQTLHFIEYHGEKEVQRLKFEVRTVLTQEVPYRDGSKAGVMKTLRYYQTEVEPLSFGMPFNYCKNEMRNFLVFYGRHDLSDIWKICEMMVNYHIESFNAPAS